jgi:hypothetical protein
VGSSGWFFVHGFTEYGNHEGYLVPNTGRVDYHIKFQSMDYGSTGGYHDTGTRRLGTFGSGAQDRLGMKPVGGLFHWEA